MNDDLTQVYQAIEERDVKCKLDLKGLETTVIANDSLKQEL
jgi:rRNA processing protein Krr1/Pno1